MDFTHLENLFKNMAALILQHTIPAANISLAYPQEQPPECSTAEDIVFIRLLEQDSDYSRPLNISYESTDDTVLKHASRTRVWQLQLAIYGPAAHQNITRIKDGVFRQDIKRYLAESSVFLVPDLPLCQRITDQPAAAGFNRWDVALTFNELHMLPVEDLGSIQSVAITTKYNH